MMAAIAPMTIVVTIAIVAIMTVAIGSADRPSHAADDPACDAASRTPDDGTNRARRPAAHRGAPLCYPDHALGLGSDGESESSHHGRDFE